MKRRACLIGTCLACFNLATGASALALANRVFVSARSGNNANSCDNLNTPCQTFAGAVTQLNPDGEVIVLDSGGYGPVTITQGVTIEAPAGVTAFIHPPSSGPAVTVNAGGATVTLRGLVLNGGTAAGIEVTAVQLLSVENCSITGFTANPGGYGIHVGAAGSLNVLATTVKRCFIGLQIDNALGLANVSIDHSHLDGNAAGFRSETVSPGSSKTTATNTTANDNSEFGWLTGVAASGIEILNLEFCTGSQNGTDGLEAVSSVASSVVRLSNGTFTNNARFGINNASAGKVESRNNNTITGNATGDTNGTIDTYVPK